jgi:hypothetical protein
MIPFYIGGRIITGGIKLRRDTETLPFDYMPEWMEHDFVYVYSGVTLVVCIFV